jgi:calcium-dependent protein kinase
MAVAYFPTDFKKYQYGSGPIPFREKDWKSFNLPVISDLIIKCLQMDPEKRITAKEALKHPWFADD